MTLTREGSWRRRCILMRLTRRGLPGKCTQNNALVLLFPHNYLARGRVNDVWSNQLRALHRVIRRMPVSVSKTPASQSVTEPALRQDQSRDQWLISNIALLFHSPSPGNTTNAGIGIKDPCQPASH
ncbi:hypothetical protein J6590_016301 [Homalodisca vitripennis]|nr:hypothetical protein J6590_016301 [Homalodisca vitripennis]